MRLLSTLVSLALGAGVSVSAAQFKIGAHNFTLPDGFEIELVAGTNLVPRPIEADFDELGRLYVTDSSGSNDKVEKQLAEKPHRVVRLEDTDGDGRFDKSITFADKLMLPQGCLWFDGSLYVAAPPSIWKLTDTNSDGVADVRVEWFQGKTLTGCANDLHGPYAGPDGWIYWCKGAFAKQTYTLPNGKEFTTRASHIFRARPDGSGVEPVMTGGMDNPVGLAFTPEGERILSGTFFQNPEGGKRDGLIHALYGGVYGKPNDALEGHPRTGDLLPIMTHLGAAAPAGLMRYESDVFGKEFQNNLFVACFNMHKIVRCEMKPDGATYKTTDSDFLVSDNPDFHPTDVLEDADGSLIVVDTGGWYKLCCPTSQLHKPDVLGGIYRIRRKNAPLLSDPRGLKIEWHKMGPSAVVAYLGNERAAVRNRAVRELVARGTHDRSTFDRAARYPSVTTRQGVARALTAMPAFEARKYSRQMLRDSDASVRMITLHSVALWRDSLAFQSVLGLLKSPDASERRAAAVALGRIGANLPVPDLLSAVNGTDRSLEHAVIYSLIEIGDPTAIRNALASPRPEVQRAALLALDQMPTGNLNAAQVLPLLTSTNSLVRDAARWIVNHRTAWSGDIARWVEDQFKVVSSTAERSEFSELLARGTTQPEVRERVAAMALHPAAQATALGAMARSRLGEIPELWIDAVRTGLESKAEPIQRLAIAAAENFAAVKKPSTGLSKPLATYANDASHAKELRLRALAALPASFTPDSATFDFLRSGLTANGSIAERHAAAGVLVRARLDEPMLLALAGSLSDAGPLELPRLVGTFSRATNDNVGLALVEALQKSKAIASLRPEALQPVLTNYSLVVQTNAEALLASLNTDAAQQKKHIDDMLASVKGGDIRRGQLIFNSTKAACSACHAIGYLGGNVGPDLTRIGQIRSERDLLEAIVYPSASFVRSYEPMIVATKGGEEFSGVLKKDSADEVVLATGPNTEQRIARHDVADLRPGALSTMPAGLTEQLTKEELADLLAFLKATRW
jgi:putative membrane-bound dehydrogenase-like protein